MSHIAIVGASSSIAKDLIRAIYLADSYSLYLYVRDVAGMKAWLAHEGFSSRYDVLPYSCYGELAHDTVINFIGVGDPSRAAAMGASIFEVTADYDRMILSELKKNPHRKYLFLSSGAAYGRSFSVPVDEGTQAVVPINAISPLDYYSVAKLYAEVQHRGYQDLSIIDVRVFNYFSRYQSLDARFFIADIVNAIIDGRKLTVSSDAMVRDFIHPADFYSLIECLICAPAGNMAIDCYSLEPVEKIAMLEAMSESFGLDYEIIPGAVQSINATGTKPNYYSRSRKAADFGYQPKYSSLEGLTLEVSALLGRTHLTCEK